MLCTILGMIGIIAAVTSLGVEHNVFLLIALDAVVGFCLAWIFGLYGGITLGCAEKPGPHQRPRPL